jgi:hypothetical protein
MSPEGRPIATITPGVAIYVTALLEFVAEYILQNVGRVIERDNSDEAGIADLRKAMEEDEGTMYWWNKMSTRQEVVTKETGEINNSAKGRVGKPWKVPEASEWDEAAGRKKFQRQSLTTAMSITSPNMARQGGMAKSSSYVDHRGTPSVMSSNGRESRDSSILTGQRIASPIQTPSAYQTDMTSISSSASTDTQHLSRKQSSDKGWFGKKRSSVRSNAEMATASSSTTIPFKGTVTASDNQDSEEMNNSDDFDSLMMSNQTMKVSLTPNRLRSIEVTKQRAEDEDVDDKRNSRRRPGTLSPLLYRDGDHSSRGLPSPSPTIASRFSSQQEALAENPPRSSSRQSSVSAIRPVKKGAPAPPSSYRSVSHTEPAILDEDEHLEDNSETRRTRKDLSSRLGSGFSPTESKLQPRNETRDKSRPESSVKEMVEMFNSTPPTLSNGHFAPTSGRDSRMSQSAMSTVSNDNGNSSRKSALTSAGGKVRSLFGKRTPSTSASIAQIRTDSQDSIVMKLQSPARRAEGDSYEQPQLRRGDEKALPNTTGLAITGAGGSVALDALTIGLLEGHDKAVKETSVPKPTRKQPELEVEETDSRDISEDFASEPGEYIPLETIHVILSTDNLASGIMNGASTQTVNGLTNDTTASSAVVGLYQDVRSASSASELSLNNQQAGKGVPNRKMPWTYSRKSSASANGRRLSGTPAPIGIGRVGSGGSSSLDHGSAGDIAPPSAWSQNYAADVVNGLDGRTMTPSLITSGSPTPSSSRPSDTARTLALLNQKMKGASSVEECRFLLTQALASAAAAVRNEFDQPSSNSMMRASSALSTTLPIHSRDNDSSFGDVVMDKHSDIPDEETRGYDHNRARSRAPPLPLKDVKWSKGPSIITQDSDVGAPQQDIEAVREQLHAPIKHRNLMLPMAVGYNNDEDIEAPSYKQQGYLVAWLLEGEGHATLELSGPVQLTNGTEERASFVSADDDLDSQDLSRQDNQASLYSKRKSNVESVVSIYRDAVSEVGK